jgi:hypothetical protein
MELVKQDTKDTTIGNLKQNTPKSTKQEEEAPTV